MEAVCQIVEGGVVKRLFVRARLSGFEYQLHYLTGCAMVVVSAKSLSLSQLYVCKSE